MRLVHNWYFGVNKMASTSILTYFFVLISKHFNDEFYMYIVGYYKYYIVNSEIFARLLFREFSISELLASS